MSRNFFDDFRHDLTFALRGRRPGDTVEVRYLRDGREHTVQSVLEQRR